LARRIQLTTLRVRKAGDVLAGSVREPVSFQNCKKMNLVQNIAKQITGGISGAIAD